MDGEKPEGFTFGAEYNKTMIDQALQSSSPLSVVPSEDEVGHGTMMAGIAAGSIKEEHYFSGVAPRAELIMVKLAPAKKYNRKIWGITEDVDCYQETNILLGIEYI
jgi:subtilisin family serine protease